ncbi:hypothetical protein DSL72_006059 [Monilinia vaccinii-corymbosi]|uniref:Uncharacterized protein n=1 Tax=Monilinia vaccinii-corymbosi TaxID=61207 RepID=A0A8A3PHF1_9HELO|nr:hypothetical protein DSL72_006059 [Monilinia vaccinii-corymbosi]
MSEYNFGHPEFTQEHIEHLESNQLEACQRENESLRVTLNSLNRMLLEARAESEARLLRIQQMKEERDVAFGEGESYARGEIGGQVGVLRREKDEVVMEGEELRRKEGEMRERLRVMEERLEELMEGREGGGNAMEGVDEESVSYRLSREENERYPEELSDMKEIIREKDLRIKHLEEEARSRSTSVGETSPAESERAKGLTEQLRVVIAERDELSEQLIIVTENLMGNTPKEYTPSAPEEKKERVKSRFSAGADSESPYFYGHKWKSHGPSPLRHYFPLESDEHEDEPEEKEEEEEEEIEVEVEEEEEVEVEVEGVGEGEGEGEIKESVEKDENDNSTEDYRKEKDNPSQQLLNRIKKLEKRNMFLERHHDTEHITRAIFSLTPVHFEALRERKEGKRKEGQILLDVMSKERDSLRRQNRNLQRSLKVLDNLRSGEKQDATQIQDSLLNQKQRQMDKEAMIDYKELYDDAEAVMKEMMKTGADVDAQEVMELRSERDLLKKRKEELEEEINGPLGLRQQLASSVIEGADNVDVATQLIREKAELKRYTTERDTAVEDSHVEENLTLMQGLMDPLSQNLEIDMDQGEEKDEQYKEMSKKYQQCQGALSDEKEKVKTLERFLEEKYMEYEDLGNDEHDDSLRPRFARTLIELYHVERKLLERTIQRNHLTKSAVNCLSTVLREVETLQKKIYTMKQHADRDLERPITNFDIENGETTARLKDEVYSLTRDLDRANQRLDSAENEAGEGKDRLHNYLQASTFVQNFPHPRVKELKEYRERNCPSPEASDGEVIDYLRTQLKDSDDVLDLLSARIDVLADENGGLSHKRVEMVEKRLEECMDLVDGPWSQKEAWDNLKRMLAEAREVLRTKMEEQRASNEERDRAVEQLKKTLRESEQRNSVLAQMIHDVQEGMKSGVTHGSRIADLEEQLSKSEQRKEELIREGDEKEALIDALDTFLRAGETRTTQLEEKLNKNEETIRDLQQEKDIHKAEAERLEDLLKADETKTAEFFETLRDEEEEKYREEIERLRELLSLKEEEDEQYREEIERLHEVHMISEGKVTELLDVSSTTSTRLSDHEAEITRWKNVAGESMEEIEKLQKRSKDLEAEIESLCITNNQNAETQIGANVSNSMEAQTEKPESPPSPVPPPPVKPVPAPRKKARKKAPRKTAKDSPYNPQKGLAQEPSDEELEVSRPQSKPNTSLRRDMDDAGSSPSPAPSLMIKIRSKAHATRKKVERKEREEHDPTWKADGEDEEPDEETPAEEVVPESPVEEVPRVELEGPRRSRRTRNDDPVYVGEFIVEGPGRGQKRKSIGSKIDGGRKRGKK